LIVLDRVHSPIAYVIVQTGDVYLERDDDVPTATLTWTYPQAVALGVSTSPDLVGALARQLVLPYGGGFRRVTPDGACRGAVLMSAGRPG
jgi:hypothetical protein